MFKIRDFFQEIRTTWEPWFNQVFSVNKLRKSEAGLDISKNCHLSDIILAFFNTKYIQFRRILCQNPLAWLAVLLALSRWVGDMLSPARPYVLCDESLSTLVQVIFCWRFLKCAGGSTSPWWLQMSWCQRGIWPPGPWFNIKMTSYQTEEIPFWR